MAVSPSKHNWIQCIDFASVQRNSAVAPLAWHIATCSCEGKPNARLPGCHACAFAVNGAISATGGEHLELCMPYDAFTSADLFPPHPLTLKKMSIESRHFKTTKQWKKRSSDLQAGAPLEGPRYVLIHCGSDSVARHTECNDENVKHLKEVDATKKQLTLPANPSTLTVHRVSHL